jgi:hypothetical protein
VNADFLARASAAFERALSALELPARELGDPETLGRRAALLATAGAAWDELLGPLIAARQAQELLGVRSRQAVSDLARRGRLLALPTADGRILFPLSQFGPSGRPLPGVARVLAAFDDAAVSAWTIASWLATPQTDLDGEAPIAALKRGGEVAVARAAGRSAARLAS